MLTVIWPTELYVKSTIEKIDQCKKYMYIYHCIAYTTDSVNLYQSQKKKKINHLIYEIDCSHTELLFVIFTN